MEKVRAFVCYAHEDHKWAEEEDDDGYDLIPFLKRSLRKQVDFWQDVVSLQPGKNIKEEISARISDCRLAILLISQDFLNSSFVREFELPLIRQRRNENKLQIFPVLVNHVLWRRDDEDLKWLAEIHMLPSKCRPLSSFRRDLSQYSLQKKIILEYLDRAVEEIRRSPREKPVEIASQIETQIGRQTAVPTESQVPEAAKLKLTAVAIPSGWFSGQGNPSAYITYEVGDFHGRGLVIRLSYRLGGKWGGIIWLPPDCGPTGDIAFPNARSGKCAINLLTQGNFSKVNRLRFSARGERGGERIEFKIGSPRLLPSPGKTELVSLTAEWNDDYELDVRNLDLRQVTAPFVWAASDDANRNGAVFYLHNIRFEGSR